MVPAGAWIFSYWDYSRRRVGLLPVISATMFVVASAALQLAFRLPPDFEWLIQALGDAAAVTALVWLAVGAFYDLWPRHPRAAEGDPYRHWGLWGPPVYDRFRLWQPDLPPGPGLAVVRMDGIEATWERLARALLARLPPEDLQGLRYVALCTEDPNKKLDALGLYTVRRVCQVYVFLRPILRLAGMGDEPRRRGARVTRVLEHAMQLLSTP